MTPPSAIARFDALFITWNLAPVYDRVREGEIHNLAYLAALLSLYAGNDPSVWGYQFHRVFPAAPFSEAIAEAVGFDILAGLFRLDAGSLSLTPLGTHEVELWKSLPLNAWRSPYLQAACSAAFHLSLPVLSHGLQEEPQLRVARQLSSERRLLDELGLKVVREQFEAVSSALEQQQVPLRQAETKEELLLVAVLWLEYLRAQGAEREEANEAVA